MYVLYREGYEIYGLGETPEEARRDAARWLEGGIAEAETAQAAEHGGAVLGRLYISRCTDRLAAALSGESDELVFDRNEDGQLDIVEGENLEE